jgi:hypothetical protein
MVDQCAGSSTGAGDAVMPEVARFPQESDKDNNNTDAVRKAFLI